jgi:hypothetical protein
LTWFSRSAKQLGCSGLCGSWGLDTSHGYRSGLTVRAPVSEVREYPFLGHTWWVLTRIFPTEEKARYAWERLEREGRKAGKGTLHLGVTRHAYVEPDGSQGRAVLVTAVSHKPEGMAVAERLLAAGEPYELEPVFVEALITRRIRVVEGLLAEKAPAGAYAIRRPEQRGGHLHPDGTMDEQVGGQG